MKLVKLEVLIDKGTFSSSKEFKIIMEHIKSAVTVYATHLPMAGVSWYRCSENINERERSNGFDKRRKTHLLAGYH
ncbi:MAG: hypothetical protein JRI39_14080 [Deltaproteobacteria bacterium]|nr:hypothetical protein [Deltaproteobacteria bacterium]